MLFRQCIVGIMYHIKCRKLFTVGGGVQIFEIGKARGASPPRRCKILACDGGVGERGKCLAEILCVTADACFDMQL